MPFSTDRQLAADRMELFHAYGPTAINDAVEAALVQLAYADYPNRVILLITDGIDNYSLADQEKVVAQAKAAGVPIYAVGIGDPESKYHSGPIDKLIYGDQDVERVDAESLKTLSASAGGQSFIVPATGEDGGKRFKNAILAIAESISAGYAIGAVIPSDVSLATINVMIVNRPDLVVRAHPIAAASQAATL
jgi:hypothetical protein